MALRRDWDALGEPQRKRYVARGLREGLTPGQARDYYMRGGDLTRWRGKESHPGLSTSQYDRLISLGKQARWSEGRDGLPLSEVIDDMIRNGFDYKFIAERLREKAEARDYYSRLSKKQRKDPNYDKGPGARNIRKRIPHANIELYYYH